MAYFDENTLTTVEDLWKNLSYEKSKYHNPDLLQEEREILEFYKGWARVLNTSFVEDINTGKSYYELDDVVTYDLFGFTGRGAFTAHFEGTFGYFSNAKVRFKDLEVFATSPTSGYATMVQNLRGKSQDGKDFEMTYRITGVLSKINGKWKWVHEHVSFPVNMSTREADFTSSIDPQTAHHF